jgi:uncharacterized coiled-coil protein SlyX
MRRALIALTAVLAISLVFSGGAQAKCSLTCLNHRVRQLSSGLIKAEKTIAALSKTVTQQGQTIAAQNQTIAGQGAALAGLTQAAKFVKSLEACLREVPISEFGEIGGPFGYLFQFENEAEELETEPTTALDVPFEGEFVGAWFLIDRCNTAETASVNAASAIAPRATDPRALPQPQRRQLR